MGRNIVNARDIGLNACRHLSFDGSRIRDVLRCFCLVSEVSSCMLGGFVLVIIGLCIRCMWSRFRMLLGMSLDMICRYRISLLVVRVSIGSYNQRWKCLLFRDSIWREIETIPFLFVNCCFINLKTLFYVN